MSRSSPPVSGAAAQSLARAARRRGSAENSDTTGSNQRRRINNLARGVSQGDRTVARSKRHMILDAGSRRD